MTGGFLFDEDIREDRLSASYVFYGEETYLSDQFILQLRSALVPPDAPGFNIERFDLEESGWSDVIDAARTAPFFFSPWRIVVAEVGGESKRKISSLEEKIIKDYCLSPSSKTVLVVVVAGKVKKSHPAVKTFASLPSSAVMLRELKPLRDNDLVPWMDRRFQAFGKAVTPEAKRRLAEIIGNDLRRIDAEIQKIASFAGDRRVVDIEDVHQVCDWTKSFAQWELTDSLEKGDFEHTLIVLNQFFNEGLKAEYILGIMANFFRDILLAKLWLKENRDRKEIFAQVKPYIQEKFRTLYPSKFREFFALVEELSERELNSIIAELEQIDLAIKTTDTSPQALIERFVFEYLRGRSRQGMKPGVTWRERG
jgi:DNA polymerase-3 subunit delta